MNPTTGTFITMDTYQGSNYDPITLHKYLYANANPVTYCDPSGYMGLMSLAIGSYGSASIDSADSLNYMAILSSLKAKIFGAVAQYGTTSILEPVDTISAT